MNVGNAFDGTFWLGKVTAGVSSLAPWTELSRLGLYIFQLMLFFRQSLRGIRLPCISRSKAYRQDLRLNAASKKIWEQMRWAWISEDSCSLERLIIYLSKLIDFLRDYAAACSIFYEPDFYYLRSILQCFVFVPVTKYTNVFTTRGHWRAEGAFQINIILYMYIVWMFEGLIPRSKVYIWLYV